MLGMDEEAFAAGGQHPDAEASELAVANVVGDLAGSKRPDTGVGEDDGSGHATFSRLRLQPGKRELRNPFRCNNCQEKKRPFIR